MIDRQIARASVRIGRKLIHEKDAINVAKLGSALSMLTQAQVIAEKLPSMATNLLLIANGLAGAVSVDKDKEVKGDG